MSYSYCSIHQNGVVSPRNSMNGGRSSLVCPKPRRVGLLNDPTRPLRCHVERQVEVSDARAGSELLDIILSKGGQGADKSGTLVASSPPFFCGSPPGRVSNPLTKDARFREEKQLVPPFLTLPMMSSSPIPVTPGYNSSPNSFVRKGGVRANFGNNPVTRVEGFDCLDRDRRNCGILARA